MVVRLGKVLVVVGRWFENFYHTNHNVTAIGTQAQPHIWQWILRIVGLFATVLVTLFVTRIAKEALENQVSS